MIAVIAAIGSMSIGNMNRDAFARSSHHNNHDHEDNDVNDRHACIDQRHVCVNDRHESRDNPQEEIILSSPGLPQQQLYLHHIYGGNS
jgi:hypothetical protein